MAHVRKSRSGHIRKSANAPIRRHRSPAVSDEREDKQFRAKAGRLAMVALGNAIEWVSKREIGWALVEAERAVKLLEVAR
jgi:hypothetical protein